jgi:hypothetical protein
VRGSVVEEDVALGARTFRVPLPPISGTRSFMGDMFVETVRVHNLVMYHASCPLNLG